MKSTTITKPVNTSYTQMLAKCEAELARLSAQERTIALQLQTDRAELDSLATQAQAHETAKDIAQQSIDQRRSTLKQAETYAELAEGTTGEKPDVKKLERLLKQSQQEQMVLLDKVGKAEQAEERRSLALQEACDRHQNDLAHLADRIQVLEATKQRVFSEQGQAEYNARLQELADLQDTLTAREQAVNEAREDIEDFSRKATDSLKEWPAHAEQLMAILPYSDVTTSVLEAAIGLLDILLSSGHDVEKFDTYLLNQAGIHFGTLESLLSLEERAFHPVLYNNGSQPVTLTQKQKDLSRLLEVYRAHKKGEVE